MNRCHYKKLASVHIKIGFELDRRYRNWSNKEGWSFMRLYSNLYVRLVLLLFFFVVLFLPWLMSSSTRRCHQVWQNCDTYLINYLINLPVSSATQHATPPEFGGKWETESLNTMFPLPIYFNISSV